MAQYNQYSFDQGESEKSDKTTIILLLIVIIGIYFFYFSPIQTNEETIDTIPTQQSIITETKEIPSDDIETEIVVDWGIYSDYGVYGTIGYPEENLCESSNYGYPSYIGTQKEGETCADAMPGEENLECITNPPAKYEGTINLIEQTSNPVLTCCIEDGTCYWSKNESQS